LSVLVTGCAGFIGMHVARALLARGESVVGIDNLNDYYDPALKHARLAEIRRADGDFAFCQLDFADAATLNAALAGLEIDRIVHLGAQAGVRYSLEAPGTYIRSNLVGHANILELGRHRQVGHLVYASSSSIYGGGTTLPMSVDQRADRPLSLYAATKKSDELLSESYAHLFALPLTGLRFFTVYGPWGRPDMAMWLFTDSIIAGRPIRLFNHGRMRRDFTFIDDVVDGLIRTLDRPPGADGKPKPGGSHGPHAIYNIGNSRSEEVGQLVSLIEQSTGCSAIVEYAELQPGEMTDTFADTSAIAHETGFAARTSLDEGVPRFVEWFRNYHDR
jgi:UDP-glucuronate 4-epimerase